MTHPSAPDPPRRRDDLLLVGAVVLVAVLGRLPAFGAWWALDDWGLLARGAGLDPTPAGLQARWLSQHLWWQVTWQLFGLNADAQTVIRLALHATSALLVVRLGARLGLGRGGRLVAGLLFASSPVVFTNVYWASNIQELLGLTCALAGLEFWLVGGRSRRLVGAAFLLASFLSKETGLGLPLLLAALLAVRERRATAAADWMLLLFLALAAAMEAMLVARHFATGAGDPYEVGGPSVVLRNLGHLGWYLLAPLPVQAHRLGSPMLLPGLGLFVVWAAWAGFAWRRADRRPALLLLACLLVAAPLTPLSKFLFPYLATPPMTAFVLALGLLVPRRWSPRPLVILVLVVVGIVWSFGSMRARQGNRNELGLPADPIVRATALSWQVSRLIEDLPWPADHGAVRELVLLQIPVAPETRRDAARFGERWVAETELHRVLQGTRGPALVGGDVEVVWANALTAAPASALVLCESGEGFKPWGALPQAALYAALTDVGLGEFERARQHLLRAADEQPETVSFFWDEGAMIIPLAMVLENKEGFVDWTVAQLSGGRSSPQEVGGLQDLFFNLLEAATGRDRAGLTAGGRIIAGPDAAPADSVTTGP